MLTAIKKIEGLGVFSNYAAANTLPAFERFNLIYGENGSGKTTLSRLFCAFEAGAHAEYPDLAFTLATEAGQLANGQPYPRKVRVFNSDYIEANIGQLDGPLRHILIVGERNKELADEVKAEEAEHQERGAGVATATKAIEKLETEKGRVFSAIAKTIGEATSGSTLRGYRKQNAEAAFAKIQNPVALATLEVETHRATVRQEQMEVLPAFDLPETFDEATGEVRQATALVEELVSLANDLTMRSAQSVALQRLVDNADIARWVEQGVQLHHDHKSGRCEFCDQTLPSARMAQLAEHFGVEDQRLKLEIEETQSALSFAAREINQLSPPVKTAVYGELRNGLEEAVTAFENARSAVLLAVSESIGSLDRKLTRRTSAYDENLAIDTTPLVHSAEALAKIVRLHNEKTEGFDAAKTAARDALESHYLSTIVGQVRELDAQIATLTERRRRLTDGDDHPQTRTLQVLADSIIEKRARVSDAHAGGAELTERLKTFLGRTELTFESGADGYRVQRRGKPAKRLSEGEKTAIAFLYFIVQLGDQDFDLAEGVVVIDDPISSLDSSSIYQAFSFLKLAVKDAKQVFLLTHNFEFLKLLLNWLHNNGKVKSAYFMLVCAESAAGRSAKLIKLDQLLHDHPTEYHYLFKTLFNYKSDGTIASSYHVPNMARKLLETFLEFQHPSTGNLYKKLESTGFDEQKRTAIYKFTNDLSHRTGQGFDPALISETQKNTEYLLELIKFCAPTHYAGLEKMSA
jgi:wobble nucleotide-excising tRNase